jgi:hypothetical protein
MSPPRSISGASCQSTLPGDLSCDDEARVCTVGGSRGKPGSYTVTVDGHTQIMSKDEFAKHPPVSHGDARPVVRYDNHRELARGAVEDQMHQSVDDAWLDTLLDGLSAPGTGLLGRLLSPDAALKQDVDDRVATFGRTTTVLSDFHPPGWEHSGGDSEACYRLACEGAQHTTPTRDSPVGGGGVTLYQKVAQRITTNKDASALALAQIKAHIDAGKAVVAGVNVPAIGYAVDKVHQPVTDHFVDICGYETDARGNITALFAKDNAMPGAVDIRFDVAGDGSITKAGTESPNVKEVAKMKYQLSEVRFHASMPYTGSLQPKDDAGNVMVWQPKK